MREPAGPVSPRDPSAILERTRELAALSDALASARAGSGALVVIEGPAGIGKSRLLAASCEQAERAGMGVLRARGLELEHDVPFGVAAALFEGTLVAATPAERDRLLGGQARLAEFLLDPMRSASGDPHALVRGLYWLTANLSATPLAIVIDDAQWADRRSLAFLAHLAARLDGVPVALLMALRTGEPTTATDVLGALGESATVLAPAALSDEAVGQLIERELPGAEHAFVAACAHVSGGNPFLARELARALRDDGVRPTAASVARVEQLVPASVVHSLLTRLGRLGEAPRRIASAVAVLGDGTSLRRAVALADVEPREAEEAADALAEAGILATGEPLRFAHPLIATAVHSDQAAFARARAHRAAAALLDADGAPVQEVSAHLLLSTPEGDDWVVDTLRGAAVQALGQGDPPAAAHALVRALAEPPLAQERADVLLELAGAEVLAGEATAERRAEEALALADGPAARARALGALGRIRLMTGDHAAAADALRELLADPGLGEAESEQLLAEYLTVNTFTSSLHPEAQARLGPLLDGARRGSLPDNPGLLSHLALRLALTGHEPDTVRALAEHATADDPLVGIETYGMLMGIAVQALCCVDELDSAERIASAALVEANRQGSLFAAASASYHRAIPRYHRGALADVLADLHQAQAPLREGWPTGSAWALALEAHVQLERGQVEAARAAVGQISVQPDTMDCAIVLFARARLALADRDHASALDDALEAGRTLSDGFGIDHPGFVPWRHTAAVAAFALGRREQADELSCHDLERAQGYRVPRAIGLALRTRALTADDAGRVELLREATGALEPSFSQLQLAHALCELGGALRRLGHRSDAQVPLRRALQLADRMGALPLAETARFELRATGARPRRAAFTGVDALTPAERRVSQLAAQGLSNRQIAEELFVTLKTVQTQLSHAFRKLEITSRQQLVALFRDA